MGICGKAIAYLRWLFGDSKSGQPRLRFWIDRDGVLWKGPSALDDTLHYAKFGGFMTVPPWAPIWTLARSDPPENAMELKTEE